MGGAAEGGKVGMMEVHGGKCVRDVHEEPVKQLTWAKQINQRGMSMESPGLYRQQVPGENRDDKVKEVPVTSGEDLRIHTRFKVSQH